MCEIAILDPLEYSTDELKSASMDLYEAMRDSLGIVAVHEDRDNEIYEYDIHKSVEPDREDVLDFVTEARDDEAMRLIIHGRMATQGAVTDSHAHPLEVDCPQCNIDYVIHNGVIGGFQRARDDHEFFGHEYNTEVDSEVIAHEFREIPNNFDDGTHDQFDYQPAYILLNEDRIFIHGKRYHLTKTGLMSLTYREFGPDPATKNYHQVILRPRPR